MHLAHDGVAWLGIKFYLLATNLESFLDLALSKFRRVRDVKERERNITLQNTIIRASTSEAVEANDNG
jgi:hypothetical protein